MASQYVQPQYQATASFQLERTAPSATIAAILDRRSARIQAGGPLAKDERIVVHAMPGDRIVKVQAWAATSDRARSLVNNVSADLLADERRVDRTRLAAEIEIAQERLNAVPFTQSRARAASTAQLARLKERQVTDSDFRGATDSVTVREQAPLHHGAYALVVGLLIAYALGVSLDALTTPRRRSFTE